MNRLFLIIAALIIVISLSFSYLKEIRKDRHSFLFVEGNTGFLYQKKEILLDQIEDFTFDDFFSFIGNQKCNYRYTFEDDTIVVTVNEQTFTFPYEIKEPIKEIVEKVVIKEVYKEKPVNTADSVTVTTDIGSNDKYFNVRKDYFLFSEGTDLSIIIRQISGAVDTNERILIDYSMLNPNEKGTYDVNLTSDEHSARITVEIV